MCFIFRWFCPSSRWCRSWLTLLLVASAMVLAGLSLLRTASPEPRIHESLQRVIVEESSRWQFLHQQKQSTNQMKKLLSVYLDSSGTQLPTIYAVTPTYDRPQQIAELTRLSQTLMHVPSIYWIIGEDAKVPSPRLQHFLQQLIVPHTHLLTPMPDKYRQDKQLTNKPKGVAARNAAIEWVRNNTRDGVLYFMDDDNTYDLRLFGEMRWTQRVSMWPVGLVTGLAMSSPILRSGRLVGWYDGFIMNRKFPVDMAGFAVNISYLIEVPNASMPYQAGQEEDGFLRSLQINPADLEFKANGCTEVYVWHTRTSRGPEASRIMLDKAYNNTNIRKMEKHVLLESLTPAHANKSYDKDIKNMMKVRN